MSHRKSVFFVSDRTGITVEALGSSLLTQFADFDFVRVTLPFIDTVAKAHEAVDQVNARPTGTPASARSSSAPSWTTPCAPRSTRPTRWCSTSSSASSCRSRASSGCKSMHAVGWPTACANVKDYNHRIEAINYTLSHDDGVTHRGLEEADIVLVGVSRSGKTPTCLYMAMQFGIKAANYPLIPEDLEANRLPPVARARSSRRSGACRSRPSACTRSAGSGARIRRYAASTTAATRSPRPRSSCARRASRTSTPPPSPSRRSRPTCCTKPTSCAGCTGRFVKYGDKGSPAHKNSPIEESPMKANKRVLPAVLLSLFAAGAAPGAGAEQFSGVSCSATAFRTTAISARFSRPWDCPRRWSRRSGASPPAPGRSGRSWSRSTTA